MSMDAVFDDADLHAFVDGRLAPERAASLAESLSTDPAARARLDGWKRQNEGLRTMFASVLFEPVPVRLLAHTLAPRSAMGEPPTSSNGAGSSRRATFGAVTTASLGMALIGLALGTFAGLGADAFGLSRPPPAAIAQPVDSPSLPWLVERAVEAHRTFVRDTVRPVEFTAVEKPKLLHWLRSRFGGGARVPEFSREGWSLVGGRILPGPFGPAVLLVYGDGPERLGLTMSRWPGMDAPTLAVDSSGAVTTARWTTDGFGFALTSDQGTDWMDRNGPLLRDDVGSQGDGRVEAGSP